MGNTKWVPPGIVITQPVEELVYLCHPNLLSLLSLFCLSLLPIPFPSLARAWVNRCTSEVLLDLIPLSQLFFKLVNSSFRSDGWLVLLEIACFLETVRAALTWKQVPTSGVPLCRVRLWALLLRLYGREGVSLAGLQS